MRILLGSLTLLMAAFTVEPAAAIDYPWCAHYGGRNGGNNCGFVTWEQCRAAISGNGGMCQPNPFYAAYAGQPVRSKKAKRVYYYQ